MWARQRADEAAERLAKSTRNRLLDAIVNFKPSKKDRGKIVMISTSGKRDPQVNNKKGYLVYVTKTGKKRFVPQKHKKSGPNDALKPYRISALSPPLKQYREAGKQFLRKRLLMVETGKKKLRTVRRGQGELNGERDLVNTMTDVITHALRGQVGHRFFLVTIMVRIETPDGKPETHTVEVEISRRDHVAIERGGVKNYVRKKLWAFLATELSLAGFVTQASYNHIRKIKGNKNKPRSKWVDSRGDPWAGADLENVRITHVEFKIEQLKR